MCVNLKVEEEWVRGVYIGCGGGRVRVEVAFGEVSDAFELNGRIVMPRVQYNLIKTIIKNSFFIKLLAP